MTVLSCGVAVATFSLEDTIVKLFAGVLTFIVVLPPSIRVTCVLLTENFFSSLLSSFLPQLNKVVATTAAVRIRVVVFIFTKFFILYYFQFATKVVYFFKICKKRE